MPYLVCILITGSSRWEEEKDIPVLTSQHQDSSYPSTSEMRDPPKPTWNISACKRNGPTMSMRITTQTWPPRPEEVSCPNWILLSWFKTLVLSGMKPGTDISWMKMIRFGSTKKRGARCRTQRPSPSTWLQLRAKANSNHMSMTSMRKFPALSVLSAPNSTSSHTMPNLEFDCALKI